MASRSTDLTQVARPKPSLSVPEPFPENTTGSGQSVNDALNTAVSAEAARHAQPFRQSASNSPPLRKVPHHLSTLRFIDPTPLPTAVTTGNHNLQLDVPSPTRKDTNSAGTNLGNPHELVLATDETTGTPHSGSVVDAASTMSRRFAKRDMNPAEVAWREPLSASLNELPITAELPVAEGPVAEGPVARGSAGSAGSPLAAGITAGAAGSRKVPSRNARSAGSPLTVSSTAGAAGGKVTQHMESPYEGGKVVFSREEDGDNTMWASCSDVAIIGRKEEGSGWVLKNLLQKGPSNRLNFR